MSRRSDRTRNERRLSFEQFEKRLVMSAQAVANVLPELEIAPPAEIQRLGALSDSATTNASNTAAQFGFDGSGQTVAVIDSGIAWDHYALGAGYGEGNKVVGGWDFAENDDNPYDDGPAGYHGSHVAGIIGSLDDQYRGVSSGVDLVGLRVFGDNGEGELEWVEQALQWVHEHKDDFENPITTVNLSLGTDWNADSMPMWATLEDEFAQLESDGMFISVAAGNSFLTFGQSGLSYPAVSEHVVAVASHDSGGSLSGFSQREDGILVAPGESIRSTVPDHLFGGIAGGQFLGSTGTSMAAPYVAGASAILRQANEFVGTTEVTQELLYQQFRETADQIFDSVTGGYYYRINLEAALATVVQDRHSNSRQDATDVGALDGGETIEGTIGRISDVDQFVFSAQRSGQLTFQFGVTDKLVPQVEVNGQDVSIHGEQVTFNVVAGQKYNFSISTADGIGHYQIKVSSHGGVNEGGPGNGDELQGNDRELIDWGGVVSKQTLSYVIDGESTFALTTLRDGILTVESSIEERETMALEIYDSRMNFLKSTTAIDGELRLDVDAKAGERFFVKAIGQSESADFRISNLVSLHSGYLSVHGTNRQDAITVSVNDGFDIDVNGVKYQFDHSTVNNIRVIGHHNDDSIHVSLGSDDDRVNTRTTGLSVNNSRFHINAFEFGSISVSGGDGYDLVSMVGSSGDDLFAAGAGEDGYATTLSGAGFSSRVSGFEMVHSVATEGFNAASLNGTQANDVFVSRGEQSWLRSEGNIVMIDGYDLIRVNGGGGNDYSNLYGSVSDDQFVLTPEWANVQNDSFEISVEGISRINAFSDEGNDSVTMYDSSGDDIFDHRHGVSLLYGAQFTSWAQGFTSVDVVSVGGDDIARIFDTAGSDSFYGESGDIRMQADQLTVNARGFKHVNVISSRGGRDSAMVKGTDGNDVILIDSQSTRLTMSNDRINRFVGVEQIEIDTEGGVDLSFITGSNGRERLAASYSEIELETTVQLLRMTNVNHTHFDGNGGGDEVLVKEMGDLDLLKSLGSEAVAYLNNHSVSADDFSVLEASTVDDAMAKYDLETVDFLYMLHGNWSEK